MFSWIGGRKQCRGLRYYRIGIESPILFEKSIVSVSYQYRNSWAGKYRISIGINFSKWKVSVSVSVSPFSSIRIKISIIQKYTHLWTRKCHKNGYFHCFWSKKWLFLAKSWYQCWYQTFSNEYQYQYRYRILDLQSISISIGIEISDL